MVVTLPKSMARRCGDCCRGLGRVCAPCGPCLTTCGKICGYMFLALFAVAVFWSCWWVVILVGYCQSSPGLGLEDIRIRDMVLYQNSSTATTDTPWLVKSDISVNLSAWNKNTVAGCFTTYRRMVVSVDFKGQHILRQEVPLGFALKPRRSRPVLLDLQGDHFPMQRDLGSLLEVELRNASAVEFQFQFDTRYLRNDRKSGWNHMACDVIAKTPAASNSSQASKSTGGIVWSSCEFS